MAVILPLHRTVFSSFSSIRRLLKASRRWSSISIESMARTPRLAIMLSCSCLQGPLSTAAMRTRSHLPTAFRILHEVTVHVWASRNHDTAHLFYIWSFPTGPMRRYHSCSYTNTDIKPHPHSIKTQRTLLSLLSLWYCHPSDTTGSVKPFLKPTCSGFIGDRNELESHKLEPTNLLSMRGLKSSCFPLRWYFQCLGVELDWGGGNEGVGWGRATGKLVFKVFELVEIVVSRFTCNIKKTALVAGEGYTNWSLLPFIKISWYHVDVQVCNSIAILVYAKESSG